MGIVNQPEIWLLGFDERSKKAIYSSLLQQGFQVVHVGGHVAGETLSAITTSIFIIADNENNAPKKVMESHIPEQFLSLIPTIIIAESCNEQRERTYYQEGVYDYFEASVTASVLAKAVQKVLLRHESLAVNTTRLAALAESENKYKTIAENSLDFIGILSPGLVFTYISPSIKYLLGYSPDEILNKNPFQIFTLEDIEKIPSKVIRDESLERYHYRLKHKNGEYRWFETTFKPLVNDKGETVQLLATSKNITKRKRLSFMLEEMQHLARVGGWEYYLEDDKIYGTKEIANIFGISQDRHIPFREALSMFTHTSQKMIERELSQTLEYGKSWDLELSFVDSRNQVRWVRTVGKPYYLNGRVNKLGGTLQDISERVNYEELLYKKQSELKAFVENTPAAIAMFDKNMRYIAATKRWCEDYSISEKDIIGQAHHDIFPKTSVNWSRIYERCLHGAVEKREEDKFIFPDGKVEWLKWEIRPWYNYRNEIGGLLAMSEIITARKEAEEVAYQQQKRMRDIYEITSDITGDISDRIRKVIEKATLALGMDFGILSKISGNNYLIKDHHDPTGLLSPNQRVYPLNNTLCDITFKENGMVAIDALASSPYKSHATVSNIAVASYIGLPIWRGGEKYGTLSFSSQNAQKDEISQADQDFVQLLGQWIGAAIDRRTFEREIVVAKEKAEEASKAKAHFLSTMSHEIRTPLNAVVGISYLLMQQEPKEEQIKNLQTLQFSANNLLALINDILDFSKIESGKIEIERIEYDLKLMLERLYSMLEFKAIEKNIDLSMQISPALPVKVKGDPTRLNQIVTNLVSNAIKFTEIGGVYISVDVMEETTKNIALKITITDTGIGIPKEKLQNIFDSFTQASADTSRKYGGTGLGLSISKKLAEMQGGNITVESTVGKGSVFTVHLTMEKASTDSAPEIITENEWENADIFGATVLLVEDNEVNQLVAKQFFKNKDIKVDVAANGLIALEKIKSMEYDLILMDLQMPEMDGYEAAQKIRSIQDRYFQEIPIIALTASTMSEVRKRVLASGMNDYISKPFVPDTFYNCLYKYINKSLKKNLNNTSKEFEPVLIEFDKVLEFAFGEISFYHELLGKIKDEFITFKQQFSEALVVNDIDKIGFLKHRLSSSLKILGLVDLEKNIEAIQATVSNKAPEDEIQLALTMIQVECDTIIRNISTELEKTSEQTQNN